MSKDTRDIDDADNMDGDMRAVDEEIVMLLPPYHKGQIGIFVMVVFLFCAHVTIVIWPLWALMNSAVSSPALGAIFFFKGIFAQCAQYMPGQFQCDNFLRPVFSLTAYAICQRAFAVLSCIIMGVALILLLLGMECSKVLLRTPEIKVRIMKIAAITTGVGGFLLLFVAALYASSLAQEFYNSEILGTASIFSGKSQLDVDQIRFELGGCIYAAFCISSLELGCACLMWYFRGFDVARQITDTKEVDKDNEYETKLRNLISENKAGRKEYTELSAYN